MQVTLNKVDQMKWTAFIDIDHPVPGKQREKMYYSSTFVLPEERTCDYTVWETSWYLEVEFSVMDFQENNQSSLFESS